MTTDLSRVFKNFHPAGTANFPTPVRSPQGLHGKAPAGLFLIQGPGRLRWVLKFFLKTMAQKTGLAFWISDGGWLYPLSLPEEARKILVLAKASNSQEVWQFGLEATQSGIFPWVLMQPSQGCAVSLLRKLQLACEKRQTLCLILFKNKLPHWVFHQTLTIPADELSS